jgi:leucyl aminopeptidase (aminopeptidase T)
MGISIDYMKAARLCVETCMGVKPGESVLVVTMPDSMEQAEAVAAAVFQQDALPVIVSIPSKRLYKAKEPPRMVVEAMKSADVIMVVMRFLDSHLMYHTSARVEALRAGARLGNVWLTDTNWDITADEIVATRDLSIRIQQRLTAAKTARLTTPRGTDLRMDLSGRESVMLSSILHHPGTRVWCPDMQRRTLLR